ncbi:hypothetical protein V6Z12_D08G149400 [Gossypium hirsutum]
MHLTTGLMLKEHSVRSSSFVTWIMIILSKSRT